MSRPLPVGREVPNGPSLIRRVSGAVAWTISALALGACAAVPTTGQAAPGAAEAATDAPAMSITVAAAASLTGPFTAIGTAFEQAHAGAAVRFHFAASSELATQLAEGAPGDVFASADLKSMTGLIDKGKVAGSPRLFASNRLEIIVPPGNPLGVAQVSDLAREDLLVVTCAPEVPIGAYTGQLLAKVGVTLTPASLEQNVKGIVTKVTLGEADAGIVYRTDVIAAGDKAQGVVIPDAVNVRAAYPIAVTRTAANPTLAGAFVDFVLSASGQAILQGYGFGPP